MINELIAAFKLIDASYFKPTIDTLEQLETAHIDDDLSMPNGFEVFANKVLVMKMATDIVIKYYNEKNNPKWFSTICTLPFGSSIFWNTEYNGNELGLFIEICIREK